MEFSIHLLEELEKTKKRKLEKTRMEILNRCKMVLKNFLNQFPMKELYLTGSVLTPGKFNENSDIDIAVVGLPEKDYFKSIAYLEEKLLRKVEIIELENCKFAENIRMKGLKINPK